MNFTTQFFGYIVLFEQFFFVLKNVKTEKGGSFLEGGGKISKAWK